MELVVLSHEQVEDLLPMGECIDVMADALVTLAKGEAFNPLRSVVRPEGTSHFLGLMPAYRGGDEPAYALKEVCIFPDNPARGLDAHQGAVLLHSAVTGELLAIMNGSAVTAIRTAAVSGVATRLLARHSRTRLAIIGTGVQARSHIRAMTALGGFESIRVVGRRADTASALAEELRGTVPVDIAAVETVEQAVQGADVICTTTNSSEPVLRRDWIEAGTHINAVGSSIPAARELDTATMAAAKLFVDRRESTLNESGDYLFAARDGAIGPDHIQAELGELLAGTRPGRGSEDEITLFKSLGIAIEDLAAAHHLYKKALETGVGARVTY